MEKTNFISENQELEEDIHISCDHSYEADKIAANAFMSRGLKSPPNPEENYTTMHVVNWEIMIG